MATDYIKSSLVSGNICIYGKRTSVRLEPEMWTALEQIAERETCSIHDICSLIYTRKTENSTLTAAIRVFTMLYYKAASTEEGHRLAGHGSVEKMKRRARITDSMIYSERQHAANKNTGNGYQHPPMVDCPL
jgi:predicted DNA-binding ribbon-helix-helix protein